MNAKPLKETCLMWNKIITPTFIAEGCRTQGSLLFSAQAEIFGTIEGDLEQESTEALQVGKSGWIHGSIRSKGPVLVEGRVEGSIVSKSKICLGRTASVLGTLNAPLITVEAGAVFEGEVKMPSSVVSSLKIAA